MSKSKKEEPFDFKEAIESFLESKKAPAVAAKVVLAIIGLGGIVFVGAVAPGILKVSRGYKRSEKYSDKKIINAVYSLERRKFVKIIKRKSGKTEVKLTNKGNKRIKEFYFKSLKISKPKEWDGKWRVVIFDIPVDKNSAREAFRRKIKELGLYQFQRSVWIYPYNCEDEMLFVAEFFNVSQYLEIFIAEKMLHEKELKKHFGL
ncbi:MAG: phenylacetic acid degradation operon negative regulatory protein [Parcubacteria group bacterium Athens0714_25]|nr:MAG: phenylacetic acid degradation operon negative regulatory protein [Parcubacteria group bacterium Athens0714_25]